MPNTPKEKEIVNQFGQLMMSEVRDYACGIAEGLVNGKGRSEPWVKLIEDLKKLKLKPEENEIIVRYAIEAIDQALFHVFRFADDYEVGIQFQNQNKTGEFHDMSKISDGLAGEMLGEEGWIARFSKYPSNYAQ
jgi:hypothetical protein